MITHNASVSACEKGLWPQRLPPKAKAITRNARVSACATWSLSWVLVSSLGALKGLRPQRLLPKVITHSAGISACEKGNQPQQALQF